MLLQTVLENRLGEKESATGAHERLKAGTTVADLQDGFHSGSDVFRVYTSGHTCPLVLTQKGGFRGMLLQTVLENRLGEKALLESMSD